MHGASCSANYSAEPSRQTSDQSSSISEQSEGDLVSSSQQISSGLKLPENFTIREAMKGGDCFFDAVAQALKQLKPEMDFTVKSLREVCKTFAQSQLSSGSSWLTEALKNDYRDISYYIPRIEFTANEIEKGSEVIDVLNLTTPMWGLPEIEGRIICIVYGVRLHFIEETTNCDKESVITHHIIDEEGYQDDILDLEILNKKVYNREDTIHIINKEGFHFEPILRIVQQSVPYCYNTVTNEEKSDSESVCFQQISEAKMKDVIDNQMNCEYFEDRSSIEEFQRKQSYRSQGSSTRSSSASSGDVWYSASTDDESIVKMANCINSASDKVMKKAAFFVKTFVREVEEKLSEYHKEAKPGSKIRKTGKVVDQIDPIIKSAVPPGIRIIPDIINECMGGFYAKKHREKVKKVSEVVTPFKSKMRKILVKDGLEIFQNFEEQMTRVVDVSWERGIEKLAIDAAYRVINYISTNDERKEFPISHIIKGVVLGESKRKHPFTTYSGYRVKDKQSGETLITSQLYENIGIKKIEGGTTKYYQLKGCDDAEKYGYRLPFAWELEKWEEVKQKYVLVNLPEKEKYVHIFGEEKRKEELAGNILKEIDGNDLTKRKDIEELYKKIENLQTKKEESVSPFIFNLDDLSQFFVERGSMLKMLKDKLEIKRQEEVSQRVLIYGGYGAGKSELAKSYAHSIKSKSNVIWINAKSCGTLSNSFYSLAKKLRIPTEGYKGIQKINPDIEGKELVDYSDVQKKNIKSIAYNVYEELQGVESCFIFDNVSQCKEVKKFLPPSGFIFGGKHPYVLITSRSKDWEEEIEKINLDKGFSSAEALMFIEKALGIEDDSHSQIYEMVKLVEGLSYFPLALKEAAKYIKEEGISISQYLERYSKVMQGSNIDRLGERGISPELFMTLKINFDKIKEEKDIGQQSHNILTFMAYLSPDQIDTAEIFLQKKSKKDQLKVLDALNLLNKFSVIELEKSIAKVHMGVQKTMRVEKEQAGTEEETLRKVMTSFCLTSTDHITSVWSHISKYERLVNEFIDSIYDGDATILHLLAKDGNEEVIRRVLDKIDPNKLSKIINTVDKMKFTPLDCAAMRGYLEIVKYLIEKGSDLDVDNRDLTPLHWATVCGQLEVVKHFINNKYWEVDKLSGEGGTPLHYAVVSGNIDIVKYLIERGADVNLQDESTGPLHHAIEENLLDIAKYLVEKGAVINLHDRNGMRPLHYAVISGDIDIVKYLIEKGADVNLQNKDYMSPLHCAVKYGHLSVIEYLVEKGANVNLQDVDGISPVHLAAKSGRLDIVQSLVGEEIKDEDIIDSLYYTIEDNGLDIVEYSVGKEADINLKDEDGSHYDVENSYLDVSDFVREEANINLQDRFGNSPLHYASLGGHSDVVQYLITQGANVNLKNNDNNTALDYAFINGHMGVVKHFLEQRAKAELIVSSFKRKSETICKFSHRQSQMLMEERPRISGLQNHTLSDSEHVLSKKRKLENISATSEENALNIQLLQGDQDNINLPSGILMQFEGLADRMENMVNINSEMPAYSFNSVTVEPVNNKSLGGVTSADRVV